MKKWFSVLSLVFAAMFSTGAFADILTDLAVNVDASVFVYTASGGAFSGTLVSVGSGAGGVTLLSPSGGGSTEIISAAIAAFTVPPAFAAPQISPMR